MENTAKSVMEALARLASNKEALDWHQWLEGALKLTALLQTEEDELAEMEHELMRNKAMLAGTMSAAQAKILVEASDLHLQVMKKRAFIKRCDETIKVAKKHASLSAEQFRYG
jgi:hypothetical protein